MSGRTEDALPHAVLAASFDETAAAYELGRPDHPDETRCPPLIGWAC